MTSAGSPTADLWNRLCPSLLWQDAADSDPEYFRLARRLFDHPFDRRALDPKTRELVVLALQAVATQLDAAGIESSIRRAAEQGASEDEVLCVLEIVSVLGLHSCSVGIPLLVEELRRADEFDEAAPFTDREQQASETFETSGPRPRPLDAMYRAILRLDTDYFAKFTDWIDVPWRKQVLDPGTKHLICIAIDVACTHLYADGIRRHVREALALGVASDQVLEVIQLASVTGLRSMATALPTVRRVFSTSRQ